MFGVAPQTAKVTQATEPPESDATYVGPADAVHAAHSPASGWRGPGSDELGPIMSGPGASADGTVTREAVFAMTTATYGKIIVPANGMSRHHPGTMKMAKKQTTRIDIAIVYLIMRPRRSSSGDGGRDVTDWVACFFIGMTSLRRDLTLGL
jgi:hypothetical protein